MTNRTAAAALRPQVTANFEDRVASLGLGGAARHYGIGVATAGRLVARDPATRDETILALALQSKPLTGSVMARA